MKTRKLALIVLVVVVGLGVILFLRKPKEETGKTVLTFAWWGSQTRQLSEKLLGKNCLLKNQTDS